MSNEEQKYHPKFINRWAKIYVNKYLKNRKAALEWAMTFFPDDIVPLVVEESKRELKKRGINLGGN